MARLLSKLVDGNKINLEGKPYKEELLRNSGSLQNEEADFTTLGLDLPFKIADPIDNQSATTRTRLEAVRVNVINLLNTELGERVMQPNLGIKLKRYLFQPFSDEVVTGVQGSIVNTFKRWLPFVRVSNISVKQGVSSGDYAHALEVSVTFALKDDPTSLESVQLKVG